MNSLKYVTVATTLAYLTACSDKQTDPAQSSAPEVKSVASAEYDLGEANSALFQGLRSAAEEAEARATALQTRVTRFLSEPSAATLQDAQTQWHALEQAVRDLYPLVLLSQSDPQSFDEIRRTLFRIQAHPIQPGYLDRFGPYEYSGLVYDVGFPLNTQSLLQQHGLTDDEEAVLGIYAIDFMLSGIQGDRAAIDYTAFDTLNDEHLKLGLGETSEVPENRRRKLLSLQCEQLVSDLDRLKRGLASSAGMSGWLALDPNRKISVVRRSLNSGLTAFLINLANYQQSQSGKTDADLPSASEDPESGERPDISVIQQQLASLAPMGGFLAPLERDALLRAIDAAGAELKSIEASTDEAEISASLQSAYENIKALL